MPKVELSIVIACFQEMPNIRQSAQELLDTLDMMRLQYEIIFIDDQSKDDTYAFLRSFAAKHPNIRAYQNLKNIGRGGTVQRGMEIAKGDIVGFIDIDLEVPANALIPLILLIRQGFDVATAWRIYKVHLRDVHRWILSKGYNALMRIALNLPLKDTETGCKLFRREKVLPLLNKVQDTRWFWDTEIMAYAYLHKCKIVEHPSLFVRKRDKKSTVRIFQDSLTYLFNLLRFRNTYRNARKGKAKLYKSGQVLCIL